MGHRAGRALNTRPAALFVALGLIGVAACSRTVESAEPPQGVPGPLVVVTTTDQSAPAAATPAATTTTTAVARSAPTIAPTTPVPTTTTSTTTATTSTTTTTVPPLDVFEPTCVVQVRPNGTLLEIVAEFDDDSVDVETVMAENGLESDVIVPRQLLDVCVDNGIDDITGEARGERNSAIVQRSVRLQQTKLNELFAGLGINDLLVDGVSGPVTRQRLCAFRLAVNLPVTTEDMAPGGPEEAQLISTAVLPIPFNSAILAERWIIIDQTCQIMFVGEGVAALRFVFPTSTGSVGFETRPQERSRAFKFNPALENGGWHNSLTYPAAEDNPLNGNMYKPLYFDNGQAIHGANNVPTTPQSKGCARLRVEHMDQLVAWLGLSDATGIIGSRDRINVAVNVQGAFIPR